MICEHRGPWMGTGAGGRFYLLDPHADEINFEDMAIALSKICRFNGHLQSEYLFDIYSVAQHSYYVWYLVKYIWGDAEAAKWALAHDWLEAFYGDNISPLKACVPDLKVLEKNAQPILRDKYNIPYNEDIAATVTRADLTVGYREADIFQGNAKEGWNIGFIPVETMDDIDATFMCWTPEEAYHLLTKAFNEEFGGAA